MASAGRKKSIISQTGVIETPSPAVNNLNKSASQSTSLYQQCSSLKSRLLRVRGFSDYFGLIPSTDSRQSADPVTQLWDCFALGVPLCYLYNLVPNVQPLGVDVDISSFDPSNEKVRKRAIAQFAMNVQQLDGCGAFQVRDLWDRSTTDGLVKVRPPFSVLTHCTPHTHPRSSTS